MKLKYRHTVSGYTPLHGVDAQIYSQLCIDTCLDTLALMHLYLDIVVLYARNNTGP